MTILEFRTLKVGDMIDLKHYWYELVDILPNGGGSIYYTFVCDKDKRFVVHEIDNEFTGTFFINGKTASCELSCERGFNIKKVPEKQAIKIKQDQKERRELELSKIIPEKETELTNLKKEYEEIKRKSMLDRIVPGNVYRFNYNEETYVRLVREIYEHKVYTTDLVRGYSDSFYIDAFKNVEHLPELTEAYKNFKTLLEKT